MLRKSALLATSASLVVPLVIGAPPAAAAGQGWETVAGGGRGYSGPASAVVLPNPAWSGMRVAMDRHDGSVLLADGDSRVVRFAASGDSSSVVAGTTTSGHSGDGGPATAAQVATPLDVTTDDAGDVFVAEPYYVRKVTPAGVISTVVGTGGTSDAQSGVPGTSAGVQPSGIDAFGDGRLVIAEKTQVRVLGIDGVLRVLASGFNAVYEVATAPDGAVFVGDGGAGYIYRVAPDGTKTVVAGSPNGTWADGVAATSATVQNPRGLAVGPDGAVYYDDAPNSRIRRFTVGGIVTTVSDTSHATYRCTQSLALAPDGTGAATCSTSDSRQSGQVAHFSAAAGLGGVWAGTDPVVPSPDGVRGTEAWLDIVRAVAQDSAGHYWLSTGRVIREVDDNGRLVTRGSSADGFQLAIRLAPGPAGSMYVVDQVANVVRRIAADGSITTVAGNGTTTYGGDGPDATAAGLNAPQGIATGPDGTLYIADSGNDAVRAVAPGGGIATVYSGANKVVDIAVDGSTLAVATDKNIDVVDLGSRAVSHLTRTGFAVTGITSDNAGGWWVNPGGTVVDLAADGSVRPLLQPSDWGATVSQLARANDGTLLMAWGAQMRRIAAPATPNPMPSPPPNFTATGGAGRIALNWDLPTSGDDVILRMNRGSTPPRSIYDGWPVLENTDNGTVTHPATIYRDGTTGGLLVPGQVYSFAAFTHAYVPTAPGSNLVASAYSVAASATAVPTEDNTPPGQPTNLTVDPQRHTISLSWKVPTDDDFSHVVVRVAQGSQPPATPTDGTDVPVNSAYGTAAPPADTLQPDTDYSFSVFALDYRGNYSAPVTVTSRLDRTPPGPVTGLAAAPYAYSAKVAWTLPNDSDYKGVVTAIAAGTATPTAPSIPNRPQPEGTCWYAHNDSHDTPRNLTPDTDYTYAVWTCDVNGNLSAPTTVTFHTMPASAAGSSSEKPTASITRYPHIAGELLSVAGLSRPNEQVRLLTKDATHGYQAVAMTTADSSAHYSITAPLAYNTSLYVESYDGQSPVLAANLRVKVTIDTVRYQYKDKRGRCVVRFNGGTYPYIPGAAVFIRTTSGTPIGFTTVTKFGASGRYSALFGLNCGTSYSLYALISGTASNGTVYTGSGLGSTVKISTPR